MNKFQPSFSSGELTPSVHSRTDINKYASGLSTCRNFIPQIEGGVNRRTGTRYITRSRDELNAPIRLTKFKSTPDDYVLELGEEYIRFYKNKDQIQFDLDADLYSMFDPTATYAIGDKISVFNYCYLPFTNDRLLTFFYPRIGFAAGDLIHISINSSDNLQITNVGGDPRILLANTTKSKNSAALIQAAIVAAAGAATIDARYSSTVVCENSEYAADRPILAGDLIKTINDLSVVNFVFEAFKVITGDVNNTSFSPLKSYSHHASSADDYVVDQDNWVFIGGETGAAEIITPYQYEDLFALKFTQSADILFITHPDYPTYQLIRYSDTLWRFEIYDYDIPPFMLSNSRNDLLLNVSATYGSANLVANYAAFNADQANSYFKIYHDIGGQAVKQTFVGTGASTTIQCNGTWRIRSFGTTCNLDVDVEKSLDNGSTWEVVRSFSMLNIEVDTFGEIEDYALLRLNCTTFSVGNTMSLTADAFSHAGIFKATSYTSSTVLAGEVITQFSSTSISFDWAESSWSEYRGYPACSVFYQDRLCFANTYTEPQTIWMSQTGDYYNFDVSSALLDTDAISIQLASRQLNGINNLVFLNDIIALTSEDEWRIGAFDGSAITPTNISSKVQGNRGSSSIAPVVIGNKIIYPQSSSSIIRDLGYDYNSNSFTGENISVLSSHLFKNYNIVDISYIEEPNSNVYFIRDDGKIVVMSYMKEQEVVGFCLFDTLISQASSVGIQDYFESITTINNNGKDEIWVVVKRATTRRYIEVFEETKVDIEDQWFLDSAIEYTGVSTYDISGLDHLVDYTVDVLSNGNVFKSLPVNGAGVVTLPEPTTRAIVGIQYISDFESLPLTFQFDTGTTKDKKIRSHQVTFVFENTRGGWVGDPDVGTITDRANTNTLNDIMLTITDTGLFSGQYIFNINSSWGLDRKVFYRQYDPLPANILAIIPRTKIGG